MHNTHQPKGFQVRLTEHGQRHSVDQRRGRGSVGGSTLIHCSVVIRPSHNAYLRLGDVSYDFVDSVRQQLVIWKTQIWQCQRQRDNMTQDQERDNTMQDQERDNTTQDQHKERQYETRPTEKDSCDTRSTDSDSTTQDQQRDNTTQDQQKYDTRPTERQYDTRPTEIWHKTNRETIRHKTNRNMTQDQQREATRHKTNRNMTQDQHREAIRRKTNRERDRLYDTRPTEREYDTRPTERDNMSQDQQRNNTTQDQQKETKVSSSAPLTFIPLQHSLWVASDSDARHALQLIGTDRRPLGVAGDGGRVGGICTNITAVTNCISSQGYVCITDHYLLTPVQCPSLYIFWSDKCTHMHVCTHTHTSAHTHTHTYIHTHTHTQIHTHTRTNTHTHKNTHTQLQLFNTILCGPIENLLSMLCILTEILSHANMKKERKKALMISNLAILLVVFKRGCNKHRSERVNYWSSSCYVAHS